MSDCIEWERARHPRGYGAVWFGGKTWIVHRLVYWLHNGFLPEVVMHTCDNPACYNVEHLVGGTQADNMADMVSKKRNNQPKGEGHSASKLSNRQVKEIRRRVNAGPYGTAQKLAKEYGVCHTTISAIKRGIRT